MDTHWKARWTGPVEDQMGQADHPVRPLAQGREAPSGSDRALGGTLSPPRAPGRGHMGTPWHLSVMQDRVACTVSLLSGVLETSWLIPTVHV